MRLLFFGMLLLMVACKQEKQVDYQQAAANPEFYHESVREITEVIMHDIFSPPIASRIYTYANVAGYEALVPGSPENASLAGQLNGLESLPQPEVGLEYCYPLASVEAMLAVGKALIFSEEKMEECRQKVCGEMIQLGIPEEVVKRSSAYGQAVAKHILEWSSKDTYKQSRSFPKYTITDDPSKWRPTPPDYMDAVEPSWNKIRCFAMDSCSQFKPARPTAYDLDKNSPFYKEVMEVKEAINVSEAEKEERIAIAKFWDCNPFTSNHAGHVMYATKKITPGGHWINITRIAATQSKVDFLKTVEAYTLTSLALVEGFISCWDEKYRSQTVRPETVINEHIDPDWRPLLQTPPFPEYPSGHSVISAASATVLTSVFGDNFAFTDDTEEVFGLPARKFPSFFVAAEEAGISRLYGGIHFRPAIENGSKQGKQVGEWVVKKVRLKKGEAQLTTAK